MLRTDTYLVFIHSDVINSSSSCHSKLVVFDYVTGAAHAVDVGGHAEVSRWYSGRLGSPVVTPMWLPLSSRLPQARGASKPLTLLLSLGHAGLDHNRHGRHLGWCPGGQRCACLYFGITTCAI